MDLLLLELDLDRNITGHYEHRRGWLESRLLALADIFSVSVHVYAVMSNHFHVVLKLDAETASNWSPEDWTLYHSAVR